jgi:hypothetical protein
MEETVQIFLETGRLVLRRFTMADVDNLFDLLRYGRKRCYRRHGIDG